MVTTLPAALTLEPASTVMAPFARRLTIPEGALTFPETSMVEPDSVNSPPSSTGSLPELPPAAGATVSAPVALMVVCAIADAVTPAVARLKSPPTFNAPEPSPITAPDTVARVDANPFTRSPFGPTSSTPAKNERFAPAGPAGPGEPLTAEPSSGRGFAPNCFKARPAGGARPPPAPAHVL